jgi:hypothetical protein
MKVSGWVGFVALLAAGCAQPGNGSEGRPSEPPKTPTKAPPQARKVVVHTPNWSLPIDERAKSQLSEAARAELARAPVPMLVVDEPALLRAAVVTTGPHWAALSAKDGDLTVVLHGTRLAHDYPEIPEARGKSLVRGRPAFVTENEGIVSASWLEDGVAYSLELECFERSDARCQGDGHLLVLAERLRFVGGEGSTK